MVCMPLSWAIQADNAGLECNPGQWKDAEFGRAETATSFPQWFASVLAVAFLVEELYCVEPPPHPSSNDVEMSWRWFGRQSLLSSCWEPHRSFAKKVGWRNSQPPQHTLQIDKPRLCLSTAHSTTPGFHFWKKNNGLVLQWQSGMVKVMTTLQQASSLAYLQSLVLLQSIQCCGME